MLLKGLNKNECQIIWRKLHHTDFTILKYAIHPSRIFSDYSGQIAYYAAVNGYLDILKVLDGIDMDGTVFTAAQYGHINILEWAGKNANIEKICKGAIKGGQCHVLDYIDYTKIKIEYIDLFTMPWNVVKWFEARGITFEIEDFFSWGRLDILQKYYENGCQIDFDRFRMIANRYNCIEIVNWIDAIKGAQ